MGGELLDVEDGVDAGVEFDGAFLVVEDGGDGGVEGVDCFVFVQGDEWIGEEYIADGC